MCIGTLYIVSTPIGNIGDITVRAQEVLQQVNLVLCEDTRHTQKLLNQLGIRASRLQSLHEHNERQKSPGYIQAMLNGEKIALVSDAGTPLLSDPGFLLVRLARQAGVHIQVVPGACAAIAALSVSGAATDSFYFEGFLPHKTVARKKALQRIGDISCTVVLYESVHRLLGTLNDMQHVWSAQRAIIIAKELTKLHERVISGTISEVIAAFEHHPEWCQGEFVLVIPALPASSDSGVSELGKKIMHELSSELGCSKAAKIAARISGDSRNDLYKLESHHIRKV